MKKKFIVYGTLLCLIYTILTVISSSLQLFQRKATDTNIHILLRFAICVIAVSFWAVFMTVKMKNLILQTIIQYIITMGLVFAGVFVLGFYVELAHSAYRDIFLNYTIPFIIIATIAVRFEIRKRKNVS